MSTCEGEDPVQINGRLVCGPHRRASCWQSGVSWIPLGEDSDDEEEENDDPVQLANGQFVCGAHGRVFCPKCGVFYSSMQEESEDEAESQPGLRVGYTPLTTPLPARLAIPKFHPPIPGATPQDLFLQSHPSDRQYPRFVNWTNEDEILIYTDGACSNNGGINPTAGCGFVFRSPEPGKPKIGKVSLRLEEYGPTGVRYQQTSNRAELRAVIAALQFRVWYGDGRTSLVIATDSEYVVKGATEWMRRWQRKGWKTTQGTAVKNRDLWELLLELVRKHLKCGMTVRFWRIPRELNWEADQAAKEGARQESTELFQERVGYLC